MAPKKSAKKPSRKPAPKRPAARTAAARKPAPKRSAPKRRNDGRPASPWWPALAPYLVVRDGQAAIEFYARAFGFETYGEVMRGDDGAVMHAGMRLGEAAMMFGPEGLTPGMKPPAEAGAPDGLSLYVYVPDVDAVFARAQRAGAQVVQAPVDQPWGDRVAAFKDPDGYHWTFATNVKATPH